MVEAASRSRRSRSSLPASCPAYSARERLIDAAVHALGVPAAPVAVVVLLMAVTPTGEAAAVLAAAVYGAGLIAMLWLSAAYNLVGDPERKERIRRLDHAAIFLMIAGTYTPFALVSLGGRMGLGLLALVWLVALAGAALKLLRPRRYERSTTVLYLALGWIGLPLAGLLVAALPAASLLLLGAGGLLYSAGVAFHLWDSLPYQNAVWHALVLAAAACHYVAVLTTLAG